MAKGSRRSGSSKRASPVRSEANLASHPALDILLGEDSDLRLTIRRALWDIVGACPEHDASDDLLLNALELAEAATIRACLAAEGNRDQASREAESARLTEALKVLCGEYEFLGQRQAFVLRAINYAATQVPQDRAKLAREIVLYSVWKVRGIDLDIFSDKDAHDRAAVAIEKWRNAGGRGRSKWQPAQQLLAHFGMASKNAKALKETAEKYGIAYAPPIFEAGSHEVLLDEFDLISGRFTGCPCCHPEQYQLGGAKK